MIIFGFINSFDYGVPQKRKRVFFFGSKNDFSLEDPKKTHFDPKKEDLFDSNLKPHETVGSHINEFSSNKYSEEQENAELGTFYKELMKVMPGKNYLSLCNIYKLFG